MVLQMEKKCLRQIEYAGNNQLMCEGCQNPIQIGFLCLMDCDVNTREGNWHHFDCFWLAQIIGYTEIDDSALLGTFSLTHEHFCQLNSHLAKFKYPARKFTLYPCPCSDCQKELSKGYVSSSSTTSSPAPSTSTANLHGRERSKRLLEDSNIKVGAAKKQKGEREQCCRNEGEWPRLEQEQSLRELRLFYMRIPEKERIMVLHSNYQLFPTDYIFGIELLADISLFGRPALCLSCNGQIHFDSLLKHYVCTGYRTSRVKCVYRFKNPRRTKFVSPIELEEKYQISFNNSNKRIYHPGEEVEFYASLTIDSHNIVEAEETFDRQFPYVRPDQPIHETKNLQVVKNGCVMDLQIARLKGYFVHEDQSGVYSATFTFVDLFTNKNSFHKVQLIVGPYEKQFYLFHARGRIGTIIGNQSTHGYTSLEDAKLEFRKIFTEKTNYQWENRHMGGHYYGFWMYNELDKALCRTKPGSKTNLPEPTKDLIMSVFDLENLKPIAFNIDLNIMPLGKVSKKQISMAKQVLSQIDGLINMPVEYYFNIRELSNDFYGIIPHNFGLQVPEVIDSKEKIAEKVALLTKLAAFKPFDGEVDVNEDLVDSIFSSLKYSVELLDPNCEDFANIVSYMTNTQGSTHTTTQTLLNVYKVNRKREDYEHIGKIWNRKLLWHGAPKESLRGILKEGLKILDTPRTARPMFGKGLYFADMFSKSLPYCQAKENEEAYVLLCDVVLGNSYQTANANNKMNLKTLKENHSNSVKALGREYPSEHIMHRDGYSIPIGNIQKVKNPSIFGLQYNEFIIYENARVEIKYLVRVRVTSSTE